MSRAAMPSFGAASLERLATCDARLQAIAKAAIVHWDFSIICGYRGEAEQNAAFKSGASKTPWPKSMHNSLPARAFDFAPFIAELPKPVQLLIGTPEQIKIISDYYKISRGAATEMLLQHYAMIVGAMVQIGHGLGIRIRSGANWDIDQNLFDNAGKLSDWPHVELID
jgi:peptidoglycan L-alanyl-D-glutamate endopeptidase CwlK